MPPYVGFNIICLISYAGLVQSSSTINDRVADELLTRQGSALSAEFRI